MLKKSKNNIHYSYQKDTDQKLLINIHVDEEPEISHLSTPLYFPSSFTQFFSVKTFRAIYTIYSKKNRVTVPTVLTQIFFFNL
jgi:hypothetical protein